MVDSSLVDSSLVLVVATQPEDTTTTEICVIDLDQNAFAWCAERDIPASNGSPWGWISATSRGTFHFFKIDGVVLVIDGRTGRATRAFELRSADGKISGWPATLDGSALAGDVLVAEDGEYAWAVDIKAGALAWRRGPSAITVSDARSTVTSALGAVPF